MWILAWVAIVFLVVLDQLFKYWASVSLQPIGTASFIHFGNFDILGLRYLENSGAVFGSFAGMRWVLVGVTAVLIIACIIGLIRYPHRSKWLSVGLVLVIAGGIGNLIDRLFRGGLVIDYLEIRLFHFAIFNFADCCVVVGVIMLLAYFLFADTISKHKAKKKEAITEKMEEDNA